ncbi:hypothetical protein [Paenibacillus sp. NPDC058071]|uniref:hypothetical protein n=1 Tax=Paenibacillus sp. NPDC058071 TaxID=3346326 RepID=UPI0036D91B18
MRHTHKIIICALSFSLLLTGCSIIERAEEAIALIEQGRQEKEQYRQEPIEQKKEQYRQEPLERERPQPRTEIAKMFSLTYHEVAQPNPSSSIAYSALTKKKEWPNGLIVFAKKDEETDEMYLGQRDGNTVKEFGTFGSDTYLNVIDLNETEVFDEQLYWAIGYCGAACSVNYFLKDIDGSWEVILFSDRLLEIADLDGDGRREILAYNGSPSVDLMIYNKIDGQVVESDSVNEAAEAWSGNGIKFNGKNGLFESFDEPKRYYKLVSE